MQHVPQDVKNYGKKAKNRKRPLKLWGLRTNQKDSSDMCDMRCHKMTNIQEPAHSALFPMRSNDQ